MSFELVPIPSGKLGRAGFERLPAAIARAGDKAARQFFSWSENRSLHQLDQIRPVVIAGYIEQHPGSPPTVKQHLAAIRMLFDWLVIGQIVPVNPAGSVRGPK